MISQKSVKKSHKNVSIFQNVLYNEISENPMFQREMIDSGGICHVYRIE